MNKINKVKNHVVFAEFKAKKHWWMWAIFLLLHIVAIRFWALGLPVVLVVTVIIDYILLPDSTHFKYTINDKFLVIKNILFPSIEIPLHMITAVDKATLMTFRGAGVHIYEESFGSFKISYTIRRGYTKTEIVCPEDRGGFISVLASKIDPHVILIDNHESVFKKKKDID